MTTIDKILKEIAGIGFENYKDVLPKRDVKILKNLSILINRPEYISENQGKLLIKILHENIEHFGNLIHDVSELLKTPLWSKPFREIQHTRKITISQAQTGEKYIDIEFTFTANLKKIIQNLAKEVEGGIINTGTKVYRILLTEKNLMSTMHLLINYNFDISPEILGFYQTMKQWNKKEFEVDFEISSERGNSIKKLIATELGLEDEISDVILADRKIRFQYHFFPNFPKNSLTNIIAARPESRIYIDSKAITLTQVITSLKELHRMPLLVVFNGYNESESIKNLENLEIAMKNSGITENIGIYFRFENNQQGKIFNQIIANNKYNAFLDEHTQVAGIIGGKIPKFFHTTSWKPQSVISFTNNLKHNKTSVYCNDCDLIIYYNEKQPLVTSSNVM
jgi:hypothetical protein